LGLLKDYMHSTYFEEPVPPKDILDTDDDLDFKPVVLNQWNLKPLPKLVKVVNIVPPLIIVPKVKKVAQPTTGFTLGEQYSPLGYFQSDQLVDTLDDFGFVTPPRQNDFVFDAPALVPVRINNNNNSVIDYMVDTPFARPSAARTRPRELNSGIFHPDPLISTVSLLEQAVDHDVAFEDVPWDQVVAEQALLINEIREQKETLTVFETLKGLASRLSRLRK